MFAEKPSRLGGRDPWRAQPQARRQDHRLDQAQRRLEFENRIQHDPGDHGQAGDHAKKEAAPDRQGPVAAVGAVQARRQRRGDPARQPGRSGKSREDRELTDNRGRDKREQRQ
jgi:hypothetical protein